MRKLWLLKFVPSFRFGKLLTGAVILCVCLPLFYMGAIEHSEDSTPALFFSLVLAYIIPMLSHITGRAEDALRELKPRLDMDTAEYERTSIRLQSIPLWDVALQLVAGATFGFIHISYVRGSVELTIRDMLSSMDGALSTAGTMLVWTIMMTVIAMLLRQAVIFARLGARHVSISLLHTAALAPFARVSISSSLAIIGALALFPLIAFESGLDLREILPGALAMLGPLIGLFIIPIWPVHRRLSTLKKEHLASINAQIEARMHAIGGPPGAEELASLAPLLNYRRELNDASTWPFDGGNVGRLLLYLVIPPLTWVAAALMENLVNSLL